MRLNSTSPGKVLKFVYLLCLFAVMFDLLMLNMDGTLSTFTNLSPFTLILLLFIIYRGLPQFTYDSDGEVLNITSKEPNLAFLGNRFVNHVEFPKRKLMDYRITSLPFRRKLILYIKSKEKRYKKRSFSISYLRRSEVKDLKRSLERVMANNRKLEDGRE